MQGFEKKFYKDLIAWLIKHEMSLYLYMDENLTFSFGEELYFDGKEHYLYSNIISNINFQIEVMHTLFQLRRKYNLMQTIYYSGNTHILYDKDDQDRGKYIKTYGQLNKILHKKFDKEMSKEILDSL